MIWHLFLNKCQANDTFSVFAITVTVDLTFRLSHLRGFTGNATPSFPTACL